MGKGFLTVHATTASDATPVSNARIQVSDVNGTVLYDYVTDSTGMTPTMSLNAPDVSLTLVPQDAILPYAVYDILVAAEGYEGVLIRNSRIFDTSDGFLPVNMIPKEASLGREATVREINQPLHNLIIGDSDVEPRWQGELSPFDPRVLQNVVIPEKIVVHLARVTYAARDISVPFRDYIKNVTCNEIYVTWHTEAIKANVYCIVSFTLNRIFTEFYRSRGYPFDITSTTHMDHQFNEGTVIDRRVSQIVDQQFNEYIAQVGHKEPFLSMYCDGQKVKCPGQLTQWGSEDKAKAGMLARDIVRTSYAYDLEFRITNNIGGITSSYPGYVLQEGYSGADVATMQRQLIRIASSLGITSIPSADGVFGPATTAAVKALQKYAGIAQDGRVGKQTWNEIQRLYSAVTKLNEMDSEGEYIGIGTTPPSITIQQGQRGELVARLQFLINFISVYDPYVPAINQTGLYDRATADAVRDFQTSQGLVANGIVGASTWRALYDVYWGIVGNRPPVTPPPSGNYPYPGYVLRNGSSGSDVATLQTALAKISSIITQIPSPGVADGRFGGGTEASVRKFQQLWGLTVDGIVGPSTWNAIMTEYQSLLTGGGGNIVTPPAYPGYVLRNGSSGSAVTTLQTALAKIASIITQIPSPGPADGKFGGGTEASVRKFQQLWGLTVDGVVGPATWNAIMAEYASLS